jgi:hypothetical protein
MRYVRGLYAVLVPALVAALVGVARGFADQHGTVVACHHGEGVAVCPVTASGKAGHPHPEPRELALRAPDMPPGNRWVFAEPQRAPDVGGGTVIMGTPLPLLVATTPSV